MLEKGAHDLGVTVHAVAHAPTGDAMQLKPIRIGLYDQYGGSMTSGWTRWLFEQYEFPFEVVYPAALDAGDLKSKYETIVFTDGAIRRAHHIMESQGSQYYMPNQFANVANWKAHYETTAPEIIRDARGEADAFVAGMGTTGTLMGCSRCFREKNPRTKVVGIEPTLDHRIQGLKNMNESIVPEIYEPGLLDRKVVCADQDAFDTLRDLALNEGLFCGLSSGLSRWTC